MMHMSKKECAVVYTSCIISVIVDDELAIRDEQYVTIFLIFKYSFQRKYAVTVGHA